MQRFSRWDVLLAFWVVLAGGSSQAGWDPRADVQAERDAVATMARFKEEDPGLREFFDQAHGYAVFPNVGKAGMGIGGAYGTGVVYEQGRVIGKASLTQVSMGLQLGGQTYSEIIFFKDQAAIDAFKQGDYALGAQASAVVVKRGASADADYAEGVAVFTLPKAGLMMEASVAGQKFSFEPK
jgi:lipid-binding SYLF domain-containing protein